VPSIHSGGVRGGRGNRGLAPFPARNLPSNIVLARELERNVSPTEVILEPSTTIIDGMSLIQKVKQKTKHFHS
jgi:hypothetical protein